MKLFRVGLALVYGLYCSQALALDKTKEATTGKEQAPISVVEIAHNTKLSEMSGKSAKQLWQKFADEIPANEKADFLAALKSHPDFMMPKIDVIELNKQNGVAAIRVVAQLKSDTVSMEFRDDPAKPLVINGIVFSKDDVQDMNTILAKIAKDVKFKETFDSIKSSGTSSAMLLQFMQMAFTEIVPSALAEMGGGCKDGVGKICWDDATTPEAIENKPAQLVKDGVVGERELEAATQYLKSKWPDVCNPESAPACDRLKQELKALNDAERTATSGKHAGGKSGKDGDGSNSNKFWTTSNPLAWVSGIAIAALSYFGLKKIFYHKVKGYGANPSITVDPVTPINTGSAGTQ